MTRPLLAALLLAAACTSSTGPSGGAAFSATITGIGNWTSAASSARAVISNNATFTLVGGSGVNPSVGMSITLYFINKPGSYPLGVGGSVVGGSATLTQGSTSWWTGLTGASGTVQITSVSTTHIAGSFNYTAMPFLGGVTGNKEITAGQFDLPVTGTGTLTVPDNLGSSFGGSLGGAPWNAATVVTVTHPSSGTLTIGASTSDYNINLIVSNFTGATTYVLGTNTSGFTRTVTVIRTGTSQAWGGSNALTSGTVLVSSYTNTRVKGTYDIAVASSSTGSLRLTGSFDVGLQ